MAQAAEKPGAVRVDQVSGWNCLHCTDWRELPQCAVEGMFAVPVVFVCRLLPVTCSFGCMREWIGHSKKKGIGSETWLGICATLRSRPHLSISTTVLRVHSWSHTPIPIHRSPLPSSCAFLAPPIAFTGCTAMAARRPISIESFRAKLLAPYPGMSGRDISQGCCMVAADVKSNPLVQPPPSTREIYLLETLIDVLKRRPTRLAPCSSVFHAFTSRHSMSRGGSYDYENSQL
jgi:hypothetical protein